MVPRNKRGIITGYRASSENNGKEADYNDVLHVTYPEKLLLEKYITFPPERACVPTIHFAYVILSIVFAENREKSNSKNKKIGESDYGEN